MAVIGGLVGKIPKSPYYEEDKTLFYDEILSTHEPIAPSISVDPSDTAILIYTGGTTGTPKGAELTHNNLVSNIMQISEWIYLEAEDVDTPGGTRYGEDVFVGAVPWYHSYGMTVTSGGTVLNCVPALYAAIVNHPNISKFDLSSLRICSSGAAPLPPELAKSFEAVTGANLYEGYGLTETSPVTHSNPTNKRHRQFGSIGLPLPDTICKIVDMETGTKEMPVGEIGEIALHGPQVMKGYWGKPKETAEVMREFNGKRFFLTGDVGHMDDRGFTYISDRKKQMINVGGLKAYPREIEDTLFEHPKIKMAAAVGIPRVDDPGNEFVKAYIILKEGEQATQEEIIEWSRERMAGYKRPKEVDFVESLPLSNVGKVLRRVLLEEEMKKRGIAE
jgi:long-chain acyl-CoA synthetase